MYGAVAIVALKEGKVERITTKVIGKTLHIKKKKKKIENVTRRICVQL